MRHTTHAASGSPTGDVRTTAGHFLFLKYWLFQEKRTLQHPLLISPAGECEISGHPYNLDGSGSIPPRLGVLEAHQLLAAWSRTRRSHRLMEFHFYWIVCNRAPAVL